MNIMRKLSELLPIARTYLATLEDRGYDREVYTCHAASAAEDDRLISYGEYSALRFAILRELNKQWRGAEAIASIAQREGVSKLSNLRSDEYIAFRDKWLDEFQAKLESDER